MNASPMIDSKLTKWVFNAMVERGVPAERLEAAAHLRRGDLEGVDARVPVERHLELWDAAEELLGDPTLALALANELRHGDLGLAGLVAKHSNNLADSMTHLRRMFRIMNPTESMEFLVRGNYVYFVYRVLDYRYYHPRIVEEMMGGMVRLNHLLGGVEFSPLEVRFQHPAPANVADYEEMFMAPVFFDQPLNEMVWENLYMDLALVQYQPRLAQVVAGYSERLASRLVFADTAVGAVERAAFELLPSGAVTQESVGGWLGLSQAALAKGLKAEGAKFQGVVDRLLPKLAETYLSDPQLSVRDAAFLLGFDNWDAFEDAFRGWSGETVQQFRARSAQAQA